MMKPNQQYNLDSNGSLEPIIQAIHAQNGAISFKDFMELALYHPDFGFYAKGKVKWDSDYITAPEMTALFAKSVARQCQEVFKNLDQPTFLEIGAGSGHFAHDILVELETLQALPDQYLIVEISPVLQERQKKFLQSEIPHLFSRIQWLKLPPQKMNGIIFANEVMDALPVNCFLIKNKMIYERAVTYQNNHFTWLPIEPSNDFKNKIEQYFVTLPQNYISEIPVALPHWIKQIVESLQQGIILLFDYGYGRKEYYHEDRTMGTLMCYHQKLKHDDPFIFIGSQDITAHVDFTTVVENAVSLQANLLGFTTQSSFLLSCGLLDLLEKNKLPVHTHWIETQKIKKLLLPSQMGEAIKVMALGKNYSIPLLGFKHFDRSHDL